MGEATSAKCPASACGVESHRHAAQKSPSEPTARLPSPYVAAKKRPALTERKTAPLPLDAPQRRRLPPLLRRAWYGLNQAFRRRIAHTGVTPDQFTVMRTLQECDAEGVTQRVLTEAMSSDPNTVASLLERMEEAGWIERRPHERDKRAYRIRLLPAGLNVYRVTRDLAVELQAEVLQCLPEAEREHFLEQLESVAASCRTAADQAAQK
jgi:DNA-binding MarR family transcriptional regulator